ncbi:prolipoprotein diacylglyceryl transferase [Candidatus Peregrinibacteria bacterium]|nr:prolipoprotein diacylglyceryl transferase [Candidatus Peregrinibacteria bacterium]
MNWIDPILINIGPISIHWYGVMYALTFIIAYFLIHKSRITKSLELDSNQKDNFIITVILGIILGGRIGYILFYNLEYYLENPLKMLFVWEGGLSFHGGLLGVMIALFYFSKKHQIKFLKLSDIVTLIAPIGIFFGRLGNFINGELYGRTAETFCLYFPTDPENCRYPSQLFEGLSEGLLLFIILYLINKKSPRHGIISAVFLILYGVFRVIAENFRQPDPQIGFIARSLTLGQILSSLMIISGIILYIFIRKGYNKKIT